MNASREMPKYVCHKKVWALKIAEITEPTDATGTSRTIIPADEGYGPFVVDGAYMAKHKPEVGGYYVVYEDGYKSFSPAGAFESGYTPSNVGTQGQTMTPEQIARVAHEANRALCASFGDHSQLPWDQAEQWQRDSAIAGVKFRLENPDAGDDCQHNAWMKDKIDHGWKYGPVKDAERKEHPCLVPFDRLPPEQKAKDAIFSAIVNALVG